MNLFQFLFAKLVSEYLLVSLIKFNTFSLINLFLYSTFYSSSFFFFFFFKLLQNVFQSPATKQTGNRLGTSVRLAFPPDSKGVIILAILQTWSWEVQFSSVSSVAQSCPTPCDPMNHSTPGLPVHHQLLESTQTHVHRVGDAIQPCHPLSSPSPPAPNPSQHQGLFQWVNSSHEVAKVLEFQLQHQSF